MKSNFSPVDAQSLLSQWEGTFWVAGGYAIDLFLEKKTREHEDLDILILRRDVASVQTFLQDWELRVGLGEGQLEEGLFLPEDDFPADRGAIWVRKNRNSPWAFEFLVNDSEQNEWICKRNKIIRKDIEDIGLTSIEGIPYLRPEIVLLHKAKGMKEKDVQDFENTIGSLTEGAKMWLRDSLQKIHPGHCWLDQLS